MAEFLVQQPTSDEMTLDTWIGKALAFMRKSLPLDEQGFQPELRFTLLELIASENDDTVSLVLTAKKL